MDACKSHTVPPDMPDSAPHTAKNKQQKHTIRCARSSWAALLDWDPNTNVLTATLKSGATYNYHSVEAADFQSFKDVHNAGSSVGAVLGRYIRGRPFVKTKQARTHNRREMGVAALP